MCASQLKKLWNACASAAPYCTFQAAKPADVMVLYTVQFNGTQNMQM